MDRRDDNLPGLEEAHRGCLLEALADVPLGSTRKAALRRRILEATMPRAVPLMEVRRSEEGRWYPLLPGIALKPLRVDVPGWSQTSLWRLDPGARVPPHPHTADEECLVVEGSVVQGGVEYRSGDYILARRGLQHSEFVSPRGATLLIRGELSPHLLNLFSPGEERAP